MTYLLGRDAILYKSRLHRDGGQAKLIATACHRKKAFLAEMEFEETFR